MGKKTGYCIHLVLLLIFIFSCTIETNAGNHIQIPATSAITHHQEVWLTVFIHGTIIITPSLVAENMAPIMTDKAHKTRYGKTVIYARKNPVLYQNQAMQEEGLKKIDCTCVQPGYAAGALAQVFETVSKEIEKKPIHNHYYTFGWSGLISNTTRIEAANTLYYQLTQEIKHYTSKNITPKIRLIGYSHGGNVCLNLAQAAKQNNNSWHVDELLLVATPIQHETDYLIADPFFKRSYSFFSGSDRVQPIDFFSYKRFFSNRQFVSRADFKVPKSLTQIRLKVRKHLTNSQAINIPIEHKVSKHHRSVSPGHAEFWFFGWTPKNYRKKYPFYPLPTIALIPYIVHQIKQAHEKIVPEKPLTITIAPAYEQMIIENNGTNTIFTTNFMTMDTLKGLKHLAMQYKPQEYNNSYYKERTTVCNKGHARHKKDRRRIVYKD